MKLEAQELKCMDCGKKFSAPRLSDFDYGWTIFTGDKGSAFGLFRALGNPAWDFIDSILKNDESGRAAMIAYGRLIQDACAYFADAINGQRLCNQHVCPRCHSSNIEPVSPLRDVLEVPEVTHIEFLSLPRPIRRKKISEYEESRFLQESASTMFRDLDGEEEKNFRNKTQ